MLANIGPDDADYVQVVHTDSFARGVLAASGHQDFYMNGAIEQPGCYGTREQSLFCFLHSLIRSFSMHNLVFHAIVTRILQAWAAVTMTEHRYILPNQSIPTTVFGAFDAKSGKIGHLDYVEVRLIKH